MNRDEKISLFWNRVNKSGGPDACWPWTRAVYAATGYGQVSSLDDYKKPTTAHRLAWILTYGDPGTYIHPKSGRVTARRVLHRCPGGSNRLCCNPAHLDVGTDQDNADDRASEGRQARGEKMGSAKLTESQVIEIRRRYAAGESVPDLARNFGVHRGTIRPCVQRKTWTHLT